MGALDPWGREDRVEQVVRAHRDEPIGLDPPAAAQHLLHRRAQVVVSDLAEHAAEPVERQLVTFQERLLGLDRRGHRERRPRETRAHVEQVHHRPGAGQLDLGLPPIDLRRPAGAWTCGTNTSPDRQPQLAAALADMITHRRLRDLDAVLVHQPPPDPLRRVPLLARRRPDPRSATHRSARDTRPASAPAGPPAALRAAGPRDSNACRTARDAPHASRQRPDREPLPITVTSDLLEQLHSGTHFLAASDPRSMSAGSSAAVGRSGAKLRPSQWGQFRPSCAGVAHGCVAAAGETRYQPASYRAAGRSRPRLASPR